jgi:thioredoxin-related protein
MRKLCLLILLAVTSAVSSAHAAVWQTEYASAQARAYAENKVILVNFTGSDWCPGCIRLREEVFSKAEFLAFADTYLVLLEVDFPRWKQLNNAQKQANRALANKFTVTGYPTVILLNSQGERIGSAMGYMAGGPTAYTRAIEQNAGLNRKPAVLDDSEPLPLFGGAPTGPPPKYKDLTLKSISGSGTKKLALINNQTLTVGETAKVRLGAGEVKLRCEEIRDQSVVVSIEGQRGRKELHLNKSEPVLPAGPQTPADRKATKSTAKSK